jgi:hypothetical protein
MDIAELIQSLHRIAQSENMFRSGKLLFIDRKHPNSVIDPI